LAHYCIFILFYYLLVIMWAVGLEAFSLYPYRSATSCYGGADNWAKNQLGERCLGEFFFGRQTIGRQVISEKTFRQKTDGRHRPKQFTVLFCSYPRLLTFAMKFLVCGTSWTSHRSCFLGGKQIY